MTTDTILQFSGLTGYEASDRYFATRYKQGGREVYSLDLSIPQLVNLVTRPDVKRQIEGNRKIKEDHARKFSQYVRTKETWIVPPLLLRAPSGVFTFSAEQTIGGTQLGVLEVPRLARDDIYIVDGQHRMLGFHMAVETLAKELEERRSRLAQAKRNGEQSVIVHFEREVEKATRDRQRLERERVSVQIVIADDPAEFKQMFVDIADNAKGITRSTKSLFDTSKIVNRCVARVMEHPLIDGRVDIDTDRIMGTNPNLLAAAHVADLVRSVTKGVAGRMSRREEGELREEDLIRGTREYLDTMVDAFPDLAAIADGTLDPATLRKRSLLGSVVMQRILAGVYHDLIAGGDNRKPLNRLQVQAFFQKLSGHTAVPVTVDSIWFRTNKFPAGALAPTARSQDVKELAATIVKWAYNEDVPEELK